MKQNNKVVLWGVPLSSCSRLAHSVVYVIRSLPSSCFIVVLTFIGLCEYTVSASSHSTGYETEAKENRLSFITNCWLTFIHNSLLIMLTF